jgi:hypothetical protein
MENNFGDLVCSFQKSETELIGAGFSIYKGNEYFYIRIFQQALFDQDNIIPTQKGITLRIDHLNDVSDGIQKVADVMTTDKVVKVIQKNNNEQVRVGVSEFKGSIYVYVRIYFKNTEGDYLPTKKGINIPLSKYEQLVEMIKQLSKHKR